MVDMLFADAALDPVWQTRVRVAFATGSTEAILWAVSKAGLVSLKLMAGRPQDIVDVHRLEETSHGQHET